MVKAPKVSPTVEFVKNALGIISQAMASSFTPISRFASTPVYQAGRDQIVDLLDMGSSVISMDDFRPMVVEIGDAIKSADSNKEYITRAKKDREGYTFEIYKKPTQGGQFVFSTMTNSFPGSTLREFKNRISSKDKLSVLWKMMAEAGFSFTPNEEKFTAYYSPTVYGAGTKQKELPEPLELITVDTTSIKGILDKIEGSMNHLHSQKLANSVYNVTITYEVEVEDLGFDVSVIITPKILLSVSNMLLPYLAETTDKSANDFLAITWMNDAVARATKPTKGSRNLPAVDMRITSEQLRKTKERFGVAKPRVNAHGFCISKNRLPMFVPVVDSTAEYMKDNSNYSVDENGYIEYEDVSAEWASKIIMVDWFNDVIVYTNASGRISTHRLLGYVPLDATSEYVFLNTPLGDRSVKETMNNLAKVVNSIVSPSDAQQYLSADFSKTDSYNAGKITQSFMDLIISIVTIRLNRTLDVVDPGFGHEIVSQPLIKHLFGIELEELSEPHRSQCAHLAAYLKAASKKRAEVTMAVMNRIVGLEYFLVMPNKIEAAFPSIKEETLKERDKRRNNGKLLDVIDLPNLDAGPDGNLQGFLPHQVRIISESAQGADTGLVGVATGGGKSILQLADVLLKLQENPKWRPICVTKTRLVKNLISEFNYFSRGKLNVVSLTKAQMKYIQQTMKLYTAQAFVNWVKNLPPNTIFVCSYSDFSSLTPIFDDLDVPSRVMLSDIGLPQFLHIMRIIGFDIVECDESHIIKNMKSKRSRYSYSLLAQAKVKKEMSGTLLSNTAVDIIGQSYGLNPMIFGDNEDDFKDLYNISSGLIKSDESAFKINERLAKFTQRSEATREDWAYLLPDMYDQTLSPELTPKQEKFYAKLLLEAEAELKAKMDKGSPGDVDDEADPEGGDEEDEDDSMLAAIDSSLAKAEQFLLAPDTNEQYLAWSENPTGADLVSAVVKAVDAKLAEIYRNRGSDHSNNKTAVFSIHKVASIHFMKHTKFKDIALHYTAGDEQVIRKFKSDPDKLLLVADSTSLREGENLQMLSQIFTTQPTWAPGDFEQLLARMYRPDPKGTYSKDRIDHYWVIPSHMRGQPTFSTVKLARMASKAVSLARLRYERDPRWREISWEFEDLDLLRMNLKTVFQSSTQDIEPYLRAWEKFVRFERKINQDMRIKVAKITEDANPGVKLLDSSNRVIDRSLFNKLVMREARSTTMLPNSKRVFTPWARGAVPADIHRMSLSILGADKIEVGAYVMTEYGPAIVQNVGENQLTVELYGRKRAKVYRDRVAVPSGDGVKKLEDLISNNSAWATESFVDAMRNLATYDADESLAPKSGRKRTQVADNTRTTTPIPTAEPVRPKPEPAPSTRFNIKDLKEDSDEQEEEEALAIEEIYTYLMNGMPALVILEAPSGVENLGWNRVAPFVGMRFKNWKIADSFLATMLKRFSMTQSKYDLLEEEMDEFRSGNVMKLTRRVTDAQARNFFVSNHRKLGTSKDGRDRVDPYWIAIDRDVYLAFSTESHSQKVMTWLKSIASRNSGDIKTPKNFPEMHVKIFSSLSEATSDVRELGRAFSIPEGQIRQELRELKEDVQALRGKRTVPTR